MIWIWIEISLFQKRSNCRNQGQKSSRTSMQIALLLQTHQPSTFWNRNLKVIHKSFSQIHLVLESKTLHFWRLTKPDRPLWRVFYFVSRLVIMHECTSKIRQLLFLGLISLIDWRKTTLRKINLVPFLPVNNITTWKSIPRWCIRMICHFSTHLASSLSLFLFRSSLSFISRLSKIRTLSA